MEKTKKKKNKGGAPTKYNKAYVKQAFVACSEGGFTNPKLAKLFGVTRATIVKWMKDHKEFSAAVRGGKEVWDSQMVEKELLNRTKSTYYNETKKKINKEGKLVVVEVTRKKVMGDVTAQKFWLMNRNRERWPNINLSEASLKVEKADEVKDMPDDCTAKEAEQIYREMMGLDK